MTDIYEQAEMIESLERERCIAAQLAKIPTRTTLCGECEEFHVHTMHNGAKASMCIRCINETIGEIG